MPALASVLASKLSRPLVATSGEVVEEGGPWTAGPIITHSIREYPDENAFKDFAVDVGPAGLNRVIIIFQKDYFQPATTVPTLNPASTNLDFEELAAGGTTARLYCVAVPPGLSGPQVVQVHANNFWDYAAAILVAKGVEAVPASVSVNSTLEDVPEAALVFVGSDNSNGIATGSIEWDEVVDMDTGSDFNHFHIGFGRQDLYNYVYLDNGFGAIMASFSQVV